MNERCYVSMTFLNEDEKRICSLLKGIPVSSITARWEDTFDDIERHVNQSNGKFQGIVSVNFDEALNGYVDELEELAENDNIVFYGYHGPGFAYGPCEFCCNGDGIFHLVEVSTGGSYPTVQINPKTCQPFPEEFKSVVDYIVAEKKVVRFFGEYAKEFEFDPLVF